MTEQSALHTNSGQRRAGGSHGGAARAAPTAPSEFI